MPAQEATVEAPPPKVVSKALTGRIPQELEGQRQMKISGDVEIDITLGGALKNDSRRETGVLILSRERIAC